MRRSTAVVFEGSVFREESLKGVAYFLGNTRPSRSGSKVGWERFKRGIADEVLA